MPRGGRRPGAGAPKGNFNALRHGNRSRGSRVSTLLEAFADHPDRMQISRGLYEAGFFPPPRYKFNGDIRGVVRFLLQNGLRTAASDASAADGQHETLRCKTKPRIKRADGGTL